MTYEIEIIKKATDIYSTEASSSEEALRKVIKTEALEVITLIGTESSITYKVVRIMEGSREETD